LLSQSLPQKEMRIGTALYRAVEKAALREVQAKDSD